MIQRYLILIVCALAHLSAFAEGFLAGTLVKTPFGYTEIEQLKIGDKVVCYDFKGKCVTRTVTHVQQEEVDSYAQITIGNEQVFAALDHKFYVPNDNAWLEANKIQPGSVLLKRCTEYIPVDSVEVIEASTVVYDITVDELHNFCVTREDVCVHNILPIIAGIGITIGFDGAVAFTASLAAFGVTLIGGTLWSNSREKQARERYFSQSAASDKSKPKRPCDPFNPTDTDCYYVDAPYHHMNSRGTKSPAPRDGTSALHNSVRVKREEKNSDGFERIGISRYGEFVVLKFSCHDANGNCEFHGYIGGKDFWDLKEPQRQALIRNGMTTTRGRILRYGK